ncbi:MAG: hypothetical protein HQL32_10445 [Planctomycetes bacterium]|nr:hypothetical protein [Planctomycetota bacterium]
MIKNNIKNYKLTTLFSHLHRWAISKNKDNRVYFDQVLTIALIISLFLAECSITYAGEISDYQGALGSTYLGEGNGVKFALYAPNATNVQVIGDFNNWNRSDGNMQRLTSGVWVTTITNAMPGQEYKYFSESFKNPKYVQDPYGRSFNKSNNNNTIIMVDDNYDWQSENWERPDKNELVIYEMAVRHFTKGDFTITNREKYTGVVEKLPYLQDLGINAIELTPIHHHYSASTSWGYNSSGFFAPEENLSSDVSNGSAINELKKVVDEAHQAGIAVLVDVVYNHIYTECMLYKIDKNEYTYEDPDFPWGVPLDLTKPAARRLAKESIKHLLDEYRVDGFRFDATDHLETSVLIDIIDELRNEGYSDRYYTFEGFSRTTDSLIQQYNTEKGEPVISSWHAQLKSRTKSFFSSGFHYKGYTPVQFSKEDLGWNNPAEVINYISSHDLDNVMTFYDSATPQKTKLAYINVMTAQGIPMFWMGDEVLYDQTLFGEKKTSIDWAKYIDSGSDFFQYLSSLIKLRIAHPTLHQELDPADTFNFISLGRGADGGLLGYSYRGYQGDNDFVILINYGDKEVEVEVPFTKNGMWYTMCNGVEASHETPGLSSFDVSGDRTITVPALRAFIYMSAPEKQDLPEADLQWSFKWGSPGQVDDLSANGYTGTNFGAISTSGLKSAGFLFDGNDDHVIKALESSYWSEYTLSLWVKSNEPNQVNYTALMNNNANGGFQLDVDGQSNYRYRSSGIEQNMGEVAGEWTHLAISCDDQYISCYRNGQLIARQEGSGTQFSRFELGVNRMHEHFFQGEMDEVLVYKKHLSDYQVNSLYQSYFSAVDDISTIDRIAYINFDQDFSDRDANLTLNTNEVVDIYKHGGVFKGTAYLDSPEDSIVIKDNPLLNLTPTPLIERSVSLWFYARDLNGRQMIYEEGGTLRGLNIYLDDNNLKVGGWDAEFDSDDDNIWNGTFKSISGVNKYQWNHVAFVLNATQNPTSPYEGQFRAYLNGVEFDALNSMGMQLGSHGDDAGLGSLAENSKFDSEGIPESLAGKIDDFAVYNRALTPEEIMILSEQSP